MHHTGNILTRRARTVRTISRRLGHLARGVSTLQEDRSRPADTKSGDLTLQHYNNPGLEAEACCGRRWPTTVTGSFFLGGRHIDDTQPSRAAFATTVRAFSVANTSKGVHTLTVYATCLHNRRQHYVLRGNVGKPDCVRSVPPI